MIRDPNELTPVVEIDGINFKRDDLFQPYDDIPINGGKVRQCIALLDHNRHLIADKHNGLVATACSVHSPQGVIVARVAREMGFRCIVGIGGSDPSLPIGRVLYHHSLMRFAAAAGADVRVLSKIAYNAPLTSILKNLPENPFVVNFGMNLPTDPCAILETTAHQVKNVPWATDNIVVPVGSGIILGGILKGVERYFHSNEYWPRVIGIQIAGYDRSKTISEIAPHAPYEMIPDKTYPYSKEIEERIADDFILDPIYEAKAYRKMKTLELDGSVLFWVVGNTGYFR